MKITDLLETQRYRLIAMSDAMIDGDALPLCRYVYPAEPFYERIKAVYDAAFEGETKPIFYEQLFEVFKEDPELLKFILED